MANVGNNLVILRQNRNREKKSIYSRYFKESLFSFKRKPDSHDLISNMNICKKNSKTAVNNCAMSASLSYADQVRELLRKDPIDEETLQMIKHGSRGRGVVPARSSSEVERRKIVKIDLPSPSPPTTQHPQLSGECRTTGAGYHTSIDTVSKSRSRVIAR